MDNKETLTTKDFKMWLRGVEEMQDENWTPSAQQWKRIREKIDCIEDTIQSNVTPMTLDARPTYTPSGIASAPAQGAGVPFALPSHPPATGNHNNPLFGKGDGHKAVTPSSDVSAGQPYVSSFAA